MAKWAIELAPYTIYYQPRTTIKSQALADFLVDWAETQYLPPAPDSTHWRMHFDGSKMCTGLGAGVVLTYPKAISSNTHCKSILPPPTTSPNTRRSFTGSGLPKNLAFAGSCVMATLTWWSSNHLPIGTPRTQIWRATISSSSNSAEILRGANSFTCQEMTTTKQTP